MAQEPTFSAATIANHRERVAQEVLGVSGWSNVGAVNQGILEQLGDEAFMQVTEWAKWYTEVSPDVANLPTQWNEAFRIMWVRAGLRQFKSPQESAIYWTAYGKPVIEKIADHYTANWNTTTVLQDDTFTPLQMRRSVLAYCVRQRTPIFPSMLEVDRIIRDEFVKLWNERPWNFRRVLARCTLTTAGNLNATEAFTIDGIASKYLLIVGTSSNDSLISSDSNKIEWLDSTRAMEAAANYYGTTGKPRYFYDMDRGETKTIQWMPMPDQEYTVYGTFLITAPSFALGTSTTGVERMPTEFRINLLDTCIAKTISKFGREDGDAARLLADAVGERARLAQAWDSKGSTRHTAAGHHHDRYTSGLMSRWGSGIIGQSE